MKYNNKTKMNYKRSVIQKILIFMVAFAMSFAGKNQIQPVVAQITDMGSTKNGAELEAMNVVAPVAERAETTTLETAVEPSGEMKFVDSTGKEWAKQAVIFATLRSTESDKLTEIGTQLTVFLQKADGSRENQGKMQVTFSEDGKTAVGTFTVAENGQYIVEAAMEEGQKNEAIQTVDCIDRTPPKVSQMVLEPFIWIEEPVKIVVTAMDELALAENPYSWDGGASWSDKNYFWAEKEGIYRVLIKDVLGNISEAVMEAKKWQGSVCDLEGESLSKSEEIGKTEEVEQKEDSKGKSKKSTYQVKVISSKQNASEESEKQIETGNSNTTDNKEADLNQLGQKTQIETDRNSKKKKASTDNTQLQVEAAEATITLKETEKESAKNEVQERHTTDGGVNGEEKVDDFEMSYTESAKEQKNDKAAQNIKDKTGQQDEERKTVFERVKEAGAVLAKGTIATVALAAVVFFVFRGKKKDIVLFYCFEYDKVHKKLGEIKLSKKEDVYVVEIDPQLLLKEKGSHYILRFSGRFVRQHKGECVYISYLQQSFQADVQSEITFSV